MIWFVQLVVVKYNHYQVKIRLSDVRVMEVDCSTHNDKIVAPKHWIYRQTITIVRIREK